MSLEILEYPDPRLRKKCEEIKEVTPEIKKFALDMVEAMIKNQGIGLAASQVGQLQRIIVVQPITTREKGEKEKNPPQIFINPRIIKKGKETDFEEEGCLSFPDKFFRIKRTKSIKVEAIDENGEQVTVEAEGMPSRIFQHEIDHLDGILFIDRLGFWQKLKFKKLNKKKP